MGDTYVRLPEKCRIIPRFHLFYKYRNLWYFHYMPVGNDVLPELLPAPEQRRAAFDCITVQPLLN